MDGWVDAFLFGYERDFMMSLSDDKQADIFDAFNTTSRYLDGILNINIGIKHVFLCINICWTSRMVLKPEPKMRGF